MFIDLAMVAPGVLRCAIAAAVAWAAAPKRTTRVSLLQTAVATGKLQDPCPNLVAAAPTSAIPGIRVPYRLGRSKHGLGLFVLRKVRKGEEVWRYMPEQFVQLTPRNWRAVMETWIRHHAWKAKPELDEAYDRWMAHSSGEVPEEMLKVFIQYKQNHMLTYDSKDGKTKYVVLDKGDSDFMNYAPIQRSKLGDVMLQLENSSLQFGAGRPATLTQRQRDEELQRALAEVEDIQPPAAELLDREPIVALTDIETCTEMLEDYDWSGDDGLAPAWMLQVLKEHGGITWDFDDDSETSLANVE